MVRHLKVLFIFVDGLGIGSDDPVSNPLCSPQYPYLGRLLSNAVPLDACLGIEGLPQSATGQASLLTGVNAAQAVGRHIEGFPPPTLKKLIEHENLFLKLRKTGKQPTFANSYWTTDPHRIPPRRQSVTTVMTLSALGHVRGKNDLLNGKAVTHDITRWTMHQRGYDGPLVTPEEAAGHLLDVAEENDFTLFEYFLTDRAGHSGKPELAAQCLSNLERFLSRLAVFSEQPNHLLMLSSDHGNIEDRTTFSHTKNPVPLVALGHEATAFGSLRSITEVTPAILEHFAMHSPER